MDRTVSHMQDEAANFPDPVDRAAQEEEFSLELRNRDRERKLIKRSKTLKKLKTKTSATANPAAWRSAFAVWKRVRQRICALTAKPWRKFAKNRWRANPLLPHSLAGVSPAWFCCPYHD